MKKVIGIISIVLFLIIAFQSCAAGLGNALIFHIIKNKSLYLKS